MTCNACNRTIYDRLMSKTSPDNKIWHSDCLRCCECHKLLDSKYFETSGRLFCRDDYLAYFGPSCFSCSEKITENQYFFSIKRTSSSSQSPDPQMHSSNNTPFFFHDKCFACNYCARPLHKGDRYCILDVPIQSQSTTQQQLEHQQQSPAPKSLMVCYDICAIKYHSASTNTSKVPGIYPNNSKESLEPSGKSTMKQPEDLVNLKSCGSLPQEWLDTICRHLIDHMNRFGICVIDNFLGSSKGNLILNEVQKLYEAGQYTKGRLVSNKLSPKSHINEAATSSIRNDRVIWIDGCEEGCEEINNLIQIMCSVIMNSSRLALYSNKDLDKVVISKRTKAHVACYPGDGTRYIKHVDNPNNDGRVITSIYYLNKNWFSKRDGGLLRMFPAGMDEVANIEPLFDRVLFFWSDRRNPHEVLPAFRDRFAITVWYIGETRA